MSASSDTASAKDSKKGSLTKDSDSIDSEDASNNRFAVNVGSSTRKRSMPWRAEAARHFQESMDRQGEAKDSNSSSTEDASSRLTGNVGSSTRERPMPWKTEMEQSLQESLDRQGEAASTKDSMRDHVTKDSKDASGHLAGNVSSFTRRRPMPWEAEIEQSLQQSLNRQGEAFDAESKKDCVTKDSVSSAEAKSASNGRFASNVGSSTGKRPMPWEAEAARHFQESMEERSAQAERTRGALDPDEQEKIRGWIEDPISPVNGGFDLMEYMSDLQFKSFDTNATVNPATAENQHMTQNAARPGDVCQCKCCARHQDQTNFRLRNLEAAAERMLRMDARMTKLEAQGAAILQGIKRLELGQRRDEEQYETQTRTKPSGRRKPKSCS